MSSRSPSHPRPRPRWGRRLLLFFLALGVGGVGLGVAVVLALQEFLHSDRFRTLVERQTSETLRADGHFEPFSWTDTSAYSDGFSAEGYPGAAIRTLSARGLRADINLEAARDGVWEVANFDVNQLQVRLGASSSSGLHPGPGPDLEAAAPSGDGQQPAEARPGAQEPAEPAPAPGFFGRFIPRKFALRKMLIHDLQLAVDDPAGLPVELAGTRVLVEPQPGGNLRLAGSGGTLQAGGFPELAIGEILLKADDDQVYVNRFDGTFHGDAAFAVTGQIDHSHQPVALDLELDFSGLDAEKVLEPDWAKKLTGRFQGTLQVSGPASPASDTVVSGEIRLVDGLLVGLPVFDAIARWSGTDNFRRLVLSRAEASFTKRGDVLTIPELEVESTGLLRIEGAVAVDGGVVDGALQLGITPGTLRWLPGAEQKVFLREEDGFRWTTVRLSGTPGDVREDLTARLLSGAVDQVVEDATRLVPETGGRALDAAGDLLRDGAEFFRGILEKEGD